MIIHNNLNISYDISQSLDFQPEDLSTSIKYYLTENKRRIFSNEIHEFFEVYKKVKNKYPKSIIKFANGGDRNNSTTPESMFCEKNNIELLWGIGGDNKSNSSSWILQKWKEDN